MKLKDLYNLINESLHIILLDADTQNELGRYDERNCIDEKYNEYYVNYMQPDWNGKCLKVEIAE